MKIFRNVLGAACIILSVCSFAFMGSITNGLWIAGILFGLAGVGAFVLLPKQ